MGTSTLLIGAGLVLLYVGAEGLVRGSAALAVRAGLTPLVVGLTVVAFGTSSPELVVSLQAALAGSGDIAVGNVVGSNIGNIALILGVSAVIHAIGIQVQVLRFDVPVMVAASVVVVVLLSNGALGRVEGLLLTIGIIAYTIFNVRMARREIAATQEEGKETVPVARGSWVWDVVLIAGGLIFLVFGANLLVDGAVAIARGLGLSDALIGLTIVAVGTSMPELATSVVAAFKGEGDIAVGNVIGSNVFNILGILGVASFVRPLRIQNISGVDLAVMTGVALLVLPLMRTGFRLVRWEGAVLVAFYAGYVYYLLP